MVDGKRVSRRCGRVGSSAGSMWAAKLHWAAPRQLMPGKGGGRCGRGREERAGADGNSGAMCSWRPGTGRPAEVRFGVLGLVVSKHPGSSGLSGAGSSNHSPAWPNPAAAVAPALPYTPRSLPRVQACSLTCRGPRIPAACRWTPSCESRGQRSQPPRLLRWESSQARRHPQLQGHHGGGSALLLSSRRAPTAACAVLQEHGCRCGGGRASHCCGGGRSPPPLPPGCRCSAWAPVAGAGALPPAIRMHWGLRQAPFWRWAGRQALLWVQRAGCAWLQARSSIDRLNRNPSGASAKWPHARRQPVRPLCGRFRNQGRERGLQRSITAACQAAALPRSQGVPHFPRGPQRTLPLLPATRAVVQRSTTPPGGPEQQQ